MSNYLSDIRPTQERCVWDKRLTPEEIQEQILKELKEIKNAIK